MAEGGRQAHPLDDEVIFSLVTRHCLVSVRTAFSLAKIFAAAIHFLPDNSA